MPNTSALEHYLAELYRLHASGHTVAETSRYGILQTLLNAIGKTVEAYADVHLRDTGAGIPDLGIFAEQQRHMENQKPTHGVVEAKGTAENLLNIAESKQVERYAKFYGQVLVTNLYQFVLVNRERDGSLAITERFDLATSEAEFFSRTPRKLAQVHSEALTEYLRRVMRRNVPLTDAKDVAWILASYAREAKARLSANPTSMEALEHVQHQLEIALGIQFEGEKAHEFFQSTLVQTLFYGVFAAWVLWYEAKPAPNEKFDLWRDIRNLSVPAVQELFEEITRPSRLRPLGLEEILKWTAEALNRVDRTFFYQLGYHAFRLDYSALDSEDVLGGDGNAIQYFYEPFLEAFDPDLRKQLGVWYTPPEVVQYMVARVDSALREELGIVDGLADPNVYILDPCCGTGAYLIEVAECIVRTLGPREGAAVAAEMVKKALQERVYGFEIMPAPFIISHLQLGIFLSQIQTPFHAGQRAAVYLTNALTGWQEKKQEPLDLPGLRREREAAEEVKQKRPILVILGNPPYSGYAGMGMQEERDLGNAYRTTQRAPRPQGQGLNDLYVRFYRMAERRIVEQTGKGIVCYISNYSWLDGLSHTGMRERYLDTFDSITIDSLNGDKYRTGKVTPEGQPDPSIFSTEFNREGIQVGTAITLMVRKGPHEGLAKVQYRDLWGVGKLDQLLVEAQNPPYSPTPAELQRKTDYRHIEPEVRLGYPLMPRDTGVNYLEWPLLPDLFPVSFSGVQTKRDELLVDFDREELLMRIEAYFDPAVSNEQLKTQYPRFLQPSNRYEPVSIRAYLVKRGFLHSNLVRYTYRPFDLRWIYWEPETKLLGEKSPDLFPQVVPDNVFLFTTGRTRRSNIEPPIVTKLLTDLNIMDSGARGFPLYLHEQATKGDMFELGKPASVRPNLSEKASNYLAEIGVDEKALFYHSLAVLHSTAYRTENAGALRQDWPRVPLPPTRELLEASAALGQQVAALLDVEAGVQGVTAGHPRPELKDIATLTSVEGPLKFGVTAGWGRNQNGVVMPGRGRAELNPHPLTPSPLSMEGEQFDIYLNATTYWRGVPNRVWEYTLGGYQVLKKWLSYREQSVLGRELTLDEAREFMFIARRIAALLLLEPELDANYRGVTGG